MTDEVTEPEGPTPEVPDPGEATAPEEPGETTDPETPDPGETTEPEEQVIVHDNVNKEFCYLHGSDLLRIKENGSFVSLYPGANTTQVWRAISEGGAVGPQYHNYLQEGNRA